MNKEEQEGIRGFRMLKLFANVCYSELKRLAGQKADKKRIKQVAKV